MHKLTNVLLIVVAVAGCKKKSTDTCEAVIPAMLDRQTAAAMKDPATKLTPEEQKALEPTRKKFATDAIKACVDDKWSADVLACARTATSEADTKKCEAMLTPAQKATVDKLMGEGPSDGKPAGDKPADDKPAGDKPAGDKPADPPAGDKPAVDGSEAQLQLNRLGKNVKTFYATEAKFPTGESPLTPAEDCCKSPDHLCAVAPAAWATPGWQAFDFVISEPHRFRYSFKSDGTTFTAQAVGDLACDGHPVTYTLEVHAEAGNPTMSITEPPAP
ncbi:MAG: hypothetical protein NT062_23680 [Proteobacteria bacterium]|nr:hypothetical protein [Pseudomonadota bacterium]